MGADPDESDSRTSHWLHSVEGQDEHQQQVQVFLRRASQRHRRYFIFVYHRQEICQRAHNQRRSDEERVEFLRAPPVAVIVASEEDFETAKSHIGFYISQQLIFKGTA